MTPMIIAIPFWNGDKQQAINLCKILSGLQGHPIGEVAHILLVARQDCSHDQRMLDALKPKFKVFTFIANSPMRGWPGGCNGMFSEAVRHIGNNAKNLYEVIYWMEPDAIPICPNWFMDLLHEWKHRNPGVLVRGCRSDCHGDGSGDHITGCALYHPKIARLMPELTRCQVAAWDYEHRKKIVEKGQHTHTIENWYNQRNLPEDVINRADIGVRIIHGVKDLSVVNAVAKKFDIKL